MPSKTVASRVTLSAVAQDAGVAVSTASIVLSRNSVYLRNFSQTTIQRVETSAEKLGYRPSLFASGLPSKGSSLFFAAALHDLNPSFPGDRFMWGFDGDLLGGITEAAIKSRVYPITALIRPYDADSDLENLDRIIGGGVFGAIVRTPSNAAEAQLRQYMRQSRPVVVVFPTRITDWKSNAVDIDNVALGKRAGDMLASQRRKSWLIMLDDTCQSHVLRLRGFRAAAKSQHARVETLICAHGAGVEEMAGKIIAGLARLRPDGIFALTSRMAEQSLAASRRERLPESSLIGCDCSVWHRPSMPRITSLEASWREAGHVALSMLLQMREEETARCRKILLDPVLVPGDTCGEPGGPS